MKTNDNEPEDKSNGTVDFVALLFVFYVRMYFFLFRYLIYVVLKTETF